MSMNDHSYTRRYWADPILKGKRGGKKGEPDWPPLAEVLSRMSCEKDCARESAGERFAQKLKALSQRHSLHAKVCRHETCVEGWLYFGVGPIEKDLKQGLAELICEADELQLIPRPRGMPEWCECAVVLTYMTARLVFEDRQTERPAPGTGREQ